MRERDSTAANLRTLEDFPEALAAILRDREYDLHLALMDVREDAFWTDPDGFLHRSDCEVWSGVWIPTLDRWVDGDDRELLRNLGVRFHSYIDDV